MSSKRYLMEHFIYISFIHFSDRFIRVLGSDGLFVLQQIALNLGNLPARLINWLIYQSTNLIHRVNTTPDEICITKEKMQNRGGDLSIDQQIIIPSVISLLACEIAVKDTRMRRRWNQSCWKCSAMCVDNDKVSVTVILLFSRDYSRFICLYRSLFCCIWSGINSAIFQINWSVIIRIDLLYRWVFENEF